MKSKLAIMGIVSTVLLTGCGVDESKIKEVGLYSSTWGSKCELATINVFAYNNQSVEASRDFLLKDGFYSAKNKTFYKFDDEIDNDLISKSLLINGGTNELLACQKDYENDRKFENAVNYIKRIKDEPKEFKIEDSKVGIENFNKMIESVKILEDKKKQWKTIFIGIATLKYETIKYFPKDFTDEKLLIIGSQELEKFVANYSLEDYKNHIE
ncbi:hypothetical protein ACOTVL_10640 [Aliarcobacter butzleri]